MVIDNYAQYCSKEAPDGYKSKIIEYVGDEEE